MIINKTHTKTDGPTHPPLHKTLEGPSHWWDGGLAPMCSVRWEVGYTHKILTLKITSWGHFRSPFVIIKWKATIKRRGEGSREGWELTVMQERKAVGHRGCRVALWWAQQIISFIRMCKVKDKEDRPARLWRSFIPWAILSVLTFGLTREPMAIN